MSPYGSISVFLLLNLDVKGFKYFIYMYIPQGMASTDWPHPTHETTHPRYQTIAD